MALHKINHRNKEKTNRRNGEHKIKMAYMKMVLEQRINKSSRNYKAEKHENVHIALILAFKS